MASATGTTTINFGVFPGSSDASVVVTGQTTIPANALVEAWIFPAATADHSVDEHLVEQIDKPIAHSVVAGTGFTISCKCSDQSTEPITPPRMSRFLGTGQDAGAGVQDRQVRDVGGKGRRLYGLWNIGWAWNG